jgi:ABC-type transporter Mla subunit MlaD
MGIKNLILEIVKAIKIAKPNWKIQFTLEVKNNYIFRNYSNAHIS